MWLLIYSVRCSRINFSVIPKRSEVYENIVQLKSDLFIFIPTRWKLDSKNLRTMQFVQKSREIETLAPGKTAIILTWIGHELPQGFFWKIYGRSWLAKMGIISVGGVIDENYRGVIGVGLLNTSETPYEVRAWDRIAQYAIHRVEDCEREEVEELSESNRWDAGYGSSGR